MQGRHKKDTHLRLHQWSRGEAGKHFKGHGSHDIIAHLNPAKESTYSTTAFIKEKVYNPAPTSC